MVSQETYEALIAYEEHFPQGQAAGKAVGWIQGIPVKDTIP